MSDCEKSEKNSRASSPNAENNRYRSPSGSRSRSPVRSRSRSKSPRRRRITVNSKRVYVCNIPYEMKWMEIKDIFKKEVGEAPYVDMMETVDGKPKGACLLEFKDKETARKAIEKMHRYKVKDRQIVVREEKESDRQMMQQMKNQQQHSMGAGLAGPGPMGMGGMGNCGATTGSSGPSPQLLQNLGIEGPLTNTVFVANLDYKVTWKKLKDVFKLAGNVLRAEIKQDKEGKSRGMGIVTFEHPMEAVQAISMFNSQTLYDRAMVVRMDKTSVDTSNDKTTHPKVSLPSGLKSIGMGLGLGGQPMQNFNNQMSGGGGGGGGGPMGGFGGGSGGGSGSNYGNMGAMGSGMGGGMGNMGAGPMNNYSGMAGGMAGGMDNMGGGMGGGMGGNMGGMNTGMGTGMNTGMSGMAGNMSGGMLPGNMGMSGMAGMSGASNMGSGTGGMGSNMGTGMGGAGMGSNMTTGSMGAMGMSTGMSGGGSMGGMGGGGGMGDGYGMGASNLGPKNFGSNQGMGDTFSSNMSGMGGLGSMGMMGSMGNQGMSMSDMSVHGLSGMDGRTMMKNMSSSGGTGSGGGGGGGGGSTGRDDCHIAVRNLPHSFTWQMLRERFRDVGDVKYAEIKTDGGKCRGWGVVRFATPEDAQRAVNLMNHARIEGREIEVRIDRV